MVRTPQALIPYLAMLAAVLAGLLWNLGDNAARLGVTLVSGTARVGGPFQLIDQDGHARSDRDFRGRYMLVYFGYSFCPDVCPTTLAVMAGALERLGPAAARIVPIFVTVDPARDTPAVLKTYLNSFGPRFVGLTGAPPALAAMAREYHVYTARHPLAGGTYAMDHSSEIYLMRPDGRFITFYEERIGPEGLAKELRARL
ncbi:MAG: SCO family protein [Alphaproteobacteria bacterium]|nr:SCO family protein [Alphaproteobacteria bacterium]MBV9693055.1 SCO family protein [Alphaproteobacteria bacterium]